MKFSSDPYIADSQMRAIIYHLVAFGYIDADFDPAERQFIRDHIGKLVEERARTVLTDEAQLPEVVQRWTKHFHEVLEQIDHSIQVLFQESVAHGETTEQFVQARLKLGCFELLNRFQEEGQREILAAVEQLMHADGVVHPSELAFRDEIVALINGIEEVEEAELLPVDEGEVIIGETRKPKAPIPNHPFLSQHEWDFSRDPGTFSAQAKGDMQLVTKVHEVLARQRAAGAGQLGQAQTMAQFTPGTAFLDGHVRVVMPRPDHDHELLVLGDLHGCYSCLKAALLQVDFFTKAQAHADNPEVNPPIYLVFLGDYIDRGRFSLSGTLRTAMQLYVKMPEQVFLLRGNHEYYVEYNGKILAPVRPCEAMDSISAVAETEVLAAYMNLFEALPNMAAFGDFFFVHGGIPRSDTFKERFTGLPSLNDEKLRFQMMWSDPSEADVIPLDLQRASARFAFGRKQFRQFMGQVGARVMVRGHEMVPEGFRESYADPETRLLTVFSAGGHDNDDLPPDSQYRDVRPMALTISRKGGVSKVTPFEIDYKRYNDPKYNAFFSEKLSG